VNRETSHARDGPGPRCGDPATARRPVLDVAVLIDASGAMAHVRAERGPCQVGVWLVDGYAGIVPVETVALLDELLGPVS
ncbi:MAG TPA: hypothetical protein VHN18_12435, partial [Micromonosporaceae bacterium]|nr:hypothetical protein [Micromonosporaceae bacterium]